MDADTYARTIAGVIDHWWQKEVVLEKELRELEARYQALQPITSDPAKMAAAKALEAEIRSVAKGLNEIHSQMVLNVRMIQPPAPTRVPVDLTSKIPWPRGMPKGLKDYILQSIKQKGLAVTERVTVKKGPGALGVALEIKW